MHPQSVPSSRLPWLLTVLSTLGPAAIDLYLPAAAGAARSLGASPIEMQQVLSAYLLGISCMSLVLGALLDRFGRRPAALWTTALFILASLGCAMATCANEMVAWRFVQGMAGGSGMVIALSVVRDLYGSDQALRVIGRATACFVIAPVIAPFLGGWIYLWAGWRATFLALAGFGALLLLLLWRMLPETLPVSSRQSLSWTNLASGYGGLLANWRFILLVLATNAPFNGYFLYLVASPIFLGQHLGLPPERFFLFFAALMGGVAIGSLLASHCAGRVQRTMQVWVGFAVMAAMAGLNIAFDIHGGASLLGAGSALMGYAAGWALALPVLTLRLGDLDTRRPGLIASLHSAVGSLANAVVASALAPVVMHATLAMAMATLMLLSVGAAAWAAVSRDVVARPSPDPRL
jgi:DHA1 family bicyclomycin/chloramphenicol resistance-like MFS transporter